MKILVVEDQEKLAKAIKSGLEIAGFVVDCVYDGRSALRAITASDMSYDLVVLDVMLPEMNGFELVTTVRGQGSTVPILMLTARDAVADKVIGLGAGADDYLAKPFAFEELIARIHALLRRPPGVFVAQLSVQNITLDPVRHIVTKRGKTVSLTTKEFAILEFLLRHPDQVVTREQLVHHVWDESFDSWSNVVDVHMKNVRKKLQRKGEIIFETIYGIGYKINTQ